MTKLNDFKVEKLAIDKLTITLTLTNGMSMSYTSDEDIGLGDVQGILSTMTNQLYQKYPNMGYPEPGYMP